MFEIIEERMKKHLGHDKFRVIGSINGTKRKATVVVQVYALFKQFEIDLQTGEVKEFETLKIKELRNGWKTN